MFSAIAAAEYHGCHALPQRAPKGTSSSILSLRLRRCFHSREAPRPPIAYAKLLSAPRAINAISCHSRHFQNFNGISGLRYAMTESSSSHLSDDAFAHVQALLARSAASSAAGAKPFNQHHVSGTHALNDPGVNSGSMSGVTGTDYDASNDLADPIRRALLAMQEGDTREVLIQLTAIERMGREELQGLVERLPRTTFTEFFRALDPLRVARDCDPIDDSHTPMGMIKMLNMDSSVDEWGVRKLYIRLLSRLLMLMNALSAAGYPLNMEEYISLIRCAGACSDIRGAKTIWEQMITRPPATWQNTEVYTEFIKARFLTEPLYCGYQKTTRMVTPRNLHRSRLRLSRKKNMRLDTLRLVLRGTKRRLGLNKEVDHVEELMRLLRGSTPALKLFRTVTIGRRFRMDESLLCTLMVAIGRSGSLRLIGTEILTKYFGVRTPHRWPQWTRAENAALGNNFSIGTPRIRPTVRLMRAVVEVYGSNAEISTALRLVEYLSNTYNIPIPTDVWQDILEWTYIMSTPPASTAWKTADWPDKVPSPQAVELIWNAMVGPPYNVVPNFRQYNIIIRSLIGRRAYGQKSEILSHMRAAVALYDEQCREHEAAAFEYAQHLRDKISSSAAILRFERARFKKQRMWYDIADWSRAFLKDLKFSYTSPVPDPLIPDFVREFRPFLKNPIRYATPTGRVSLVDPALETFTFLDDGVIDQVIPMKNDRRKWARLHQRQHKVAVLSSHSLADYKPGMLHNPLNLLAPHRDVFESPFQNWADLEWDEMDDM
ncbi:mitochondrial ATPase expression-domain-containing protein [Xylaria intraflava]|nr:mitochondrial ATPase expression-domain-containing protein [Xylaria intraflava]